MSGAIEGHSVMGRLARQRETVVVRAEAVRRTRRAVKFLERWIEGETDERRVLLSQSEERWHRATARARRKCARVSRRARDAVGGHARARRGLAGARPPQRAVGRVPRG